MFKYTPSAAAIKKSQEFELAVVSSTIAAIKSGKDVHIASSRVFDAVCHNAVYVAPQWGFDVVPHLKSNKIGTVSYHQTAFGGSIEVDSTSWDAQKKGIAALNLSGTELFNSVKPFIDGYRELFEFGDKAPSRAEISHRCVALAKFVALHLIPYGINGAIVGSIPAFIAGEVERQFRSNGLRLWYDYNGQMVES